MPKGKLRKPMSDEQKAMRAEILAKARAAKAEKALVEKPRTREQEIVWLYQIGNSPQAIARTFKISTEEVMELIGEGNATSVQFVGDQIDASEMGKEAVYNQGTEYRVPFTTD